MATESVFVKDKKGGTGKMAFWHRKPKEKLKAGAGTGKGKVTTMRSYEKVFNNSGKHIGWITKETDYGKAAGPKGFGKKTKEITLGSGSGSGKGRKWMKVSKKGGKVK